MNTRVHIYKWLRRAAHKWLRRAALMVAVLAGAFPAAAQVAGEIDGGDAFYIYQNDGHFDGFFYDQVKQISYSRLDTLGVEYKDYVSQEIVTEDSVYRIMLTAIDSVSFVQPEIKFSKALRPMQEEGLMDYFLEYLYDPDLKHVLGFSLSTPESLWPKVGEVLYADSVAGYTDGAFVYKVTRVVKGSGMLVVCCDNITDYRDVYEQFITVEQVRNVQTPQGSRMHRRLAGYKPPRQIEGNIEEFTLFNLNTGIEAKASDGTLAVSATINVNFGMAVSSVYNISLTNWYFKHELKEQFGIGASFGLDGELANEISPSAFLQGSALANFTRIPIPATGPPLFYIAAMPEPFGRVEAHLKLMFNSGFRATGLVQTFESAETFPYIDFRYKSIKPFLGLPGNVSTDSSFSIDALLDGFVQLGVKFPVALGTQEWFNKIFGFKTALNFFAGPKLTGTLDLKKLLGSSKGWYDRLKDDKIDVSLFSVDPDFKAEVKALGGIDWELKRTTSFSFGNFTLHVFPEIKDVTFNITGDQLNKVNAKAKHIKGEVCLPQRIGFALYKNKDDNDKEYSELYRYMTRDETYFLNTFNGFDLTMESVEPGIYMAYPAVSLALGVVPVLSQGQLITIASQELELKPDTITAAEEGGKYQVELLASIDQPLTASPDDDWIETEIKYNVGATKSTIMYVTVKQNDTDRFRKSGVTVTQVLKDGGLCEKHLGVGQFGGLQLDPDKLNFEVEGGKQLVNILTSYAPITINIKDAPWLSYELDDLKLTITAQPNEGANRTAKVIVAAWNPKSQGIATVELNVTQKGLVDAKIEPTELSYPYNGGTQRVSVTTGPDVTFDKVSVSQSDESWVVVEKQKDYFNVTAIPNHLTEERSTNITAVFTGKDANGKPLTVELPVAITQAASNASVTPDVLLFSSDEGSQEALIKKESYLYQGATVGDEYKDWLSAKVDDDGKVTVTVKQNTTGRRRSGTVFCYVTNELNPTDAQIVYLPITVRQSSNVPGPQPGETLDITKFRCEVSAAGMKLASTNDPGKEFGSGEGVVPGGWGVYYGDEESAKQKVTATFGLDAIHFVVHATDEAYTSYREKMSVIYDGVPVAGKRTYTLEFDLKKTIDADDQVAGRITNMQLTYNSVETWPDRKDWGFYGEVERHSITANIDPGLLTTRLSKVRDIKIVNGKYIGFDKGIESIDMGGRNEFGTGLMPADDLVISNWNQDFAYHYYVYREKAWKDYEASYTLSGATGHGIYMSIGFHRDFITKVLQWFEDQ